MGLHFVNFFVEIIKAVYSHTHLFGRKKENAMVVLLKTHIAYFLRTSYALCAQQKKYRNALYCVLLEYLVRSCYVLGIFGFLEYQMVPFIVGELLN